MCQSSIVLVAQSCLILRSYGRSPPDSSAHGILQARILEWVAFPFPRRCSQPRDQTQVSHNAGRFFYQLSHRKAQEHWHGQPIPSPGDLRNPGIKLRSPALQADSLPTELILPKSSIFVFSFLLKYNLYMMKYTNLDTIC